MYMVYLWFTSATDTMQVPTHQHKSYDCSKSANTKCMKDGMGQLHFFLTLWNQQADWYQGYILDAYIQNSRSIDGRKPLASGPPCGIQNNPGQSGTKQQHWWEESLPSHATPAESRIGPKIAWHLNANSNCMRLGGNDGCTSHLPYCHFPIARHPIWPVVSWVIN